MCSTYRFLPISRQNLTLPRITNSHQVLNSFQLFMDLISDSFYVYHVTFSRSWDPSSCLKGLTLTLSGCRNDVSLLWMRTKKCLLVRSRSEKPPEFHLSTQGSHPTTEWQNWPFCSLELGTHELMLLWECHAL